MRKSSGQLDFEIREDIYIWSPSRTGNRLPRTRVRLHSGCEGIPPNPAEEALDRHGKIHKPHMRAMDSLTPRFDPVWVYNYLEKRKGLTWQGYHLLDEDEVDGQQCF